MNGCRLAAGTWLGTILCPAIERWTRGEPGEHVIPHVRPEALPGWRAVRSLEPKELGV